MQGGRRFHRRRRAGLQALSWGGLHAAPTLPRHTCTLWQSAGACK